MARSLEGLQKALAGRLVHQCLSIKADDTVTILCFPHTMDLAEQISLECFRTGADVLLNLYTDGYYAGYLNLLPAESLREPSKFCVALTEASSVEIFMAAAEDPAIFRSIPQEKLAASGEGEYKAHWPRARERKVRFADLALGSATAARARAYGLNHAAWRRTMYEAAAVDYTQLTKVGAKVASLLEGAREARVTDPGGTDLRFSIKGRRAYVNDGVIDKEDMARENFEISIPAGNVAIAPIEDSTEGRVVFELPILFAGRAAKGVSWRFAGGRMRRWGAGKGARPLVELYDKATGDKDRLASLTLGINPQARLGFNFNNIVAGGITLGIGSNESLGGSNKSAFFLSGTLGGATLTLDGRALVRGGKLLL